ncbi:MAG: SDR family oxidoreductase [Chloroflexi bacterium]|nr:SDR family oxidoreductase [Chloroflexota bacterium]
MSLPSFSLAGRTALVTGGSRGIGRAIALTFAEAGADVAICSRTVADGKLEAVAGEVRRLGRRSLAVQADITRQADVENMVRRVRDEFGSIDILVNNAGNYITFFLTELREKEWDMTIDTHLKGYYFCCQAVSKVMVKQKRGNIISIASDLAIKPYSESGAYSAAKAGVLMLTRSLALELGKYRIRVNAISPGMVRTEMMDYLTRDPEALREAEAAIPLGRMAETEDIAAAALFLASDASSHITGQAIVVDGGSCA